MKYRYIFILIYIFLFTVTPVIYGQNELIRLYEMNEIAELEQRWRENPNEGDEFIRSIFMKDASKSIEKMKNLIKDDHSNSSIPAIMERIALYEFSVGLYLTSKEKFKFLSNQYPYNRYGEMGLYYLARCFNAIADSDSSQVVLSEFQRKYPDSKYKDLVLQEINVGKHIASIEPEKKENNTKLISQRPVYAIQTGAFSTNSNAQLQKHFLEDKGFKPSIYQKRVNQKKYFVVCIGEFTEKDQAENYGMNISKKYKIEEYRVVDLNQLLRVR